MEVRALSNYTPAQNTTAAVEKERRSGLDTDTFLKLLVTQLRYQDPLSTGGDMGDFLTQMALFTLVEQNMKVQRALEDYTRQQSGLQALGLLNRTVEVEEYGETVRGEVTAVRFEKDKLLFTVNGKEYPFSALRLVEGEVKGEGGTGHES